MHEPGEKKTGVEVSAGVGVHEAGLRTQCMGGTSEHYSSARPLLVDILHGICRRGRVCAAAIALVNVIIGNLIQFLHVNQLDGTTPVPLPQQRTLKMDVATAIEMRQYITDHMHTGTEHRCPSLSIN